MRAVAQRIVWIIGLFCLLFGVAGLVAFSPVTVALAITGWFLSRSAIAELGRQVDAPVPSPDAQYWARRLLLRTLGLMLFGALMAASFVAGGIEFHLSVHTQALLTVLLIGTMIVVTRLTLPGFFAASWEVHGARERRQRTRPSMANSRLLVRVVAALILVTSLVGSFAMLQSIRLGAPNYRRLATMARVVSYDAPATLEGIFSPSETSTR